MPYVSVHVDADDVLDELDTDTLKKELQRRASKGEAGAGDHVDPEDALDTLRELATAIHTGRPDSVVIELAERACTAAGFNALPPPSRRQGLHA